MIRGGFWGGTWGLSWGGAWGEAWLLLNRPYQELSLKGQVFVRSYLTSIHSIEVAEQIVSVAALNNISVIDAEVVVTVSSSEDRREVVKKRSPNKVDCPGHPKLPSAKNPSDLTAKHLQDVVFAYYAANSVSAVSKHSQVIARQSTARVDLINNVT